MLKEVRAIKFYIATTLENWREHNEVRNFLRATGHEITYDWTLHGSIYSQGLDAIRQVAINEFQGVRDADIIIVLWPGGRGTHVELGMAIALEKPVFIMSPIDAHHGATKETCAFYHSPKVKMSKSLVTLYEHIAEYNRCKFVH